MPGTINCVHLALLNFSWSGSQCFGGSHSVILPPPFTHGAEEKKAEELTNAMNREHELLREEDFKAKICVENNKKLREQ